MYIISYTRAQRIKLKRDKLIFIKNVTTRVNDQDSRTNQFQVTRLLLYFVIVSYHVSCYFTLVKVI